MYTRRMVQQIGVCGSLLLAVLLMEAIGTAHVPTSAQEVISTPAGQTPVATAEATLLPSTERSAAGSVGATAGCPLDSDFNGSANGWVSHSGVWYYDSNCLYTYGLAGTWSSAS